MLVIGKGSKVRFDCLNTSFKFMFFELSLLNAISILKTSIIVPRIIKSFWWLPRQNQSDDPSAIMQEINS